MTNSTDSQVLLNSFRNWGNAGGFSTEFDVASLWSNRDFNGSTIGLAWVGGTCSSFRYNILQDFSTNAALLRVLQAHELGHNFNSGHDASGSPNIMAPAVNSTDTWSGTSVSVINNYLNFLNTNSGCMDVCNSNVPPVSEFIIPIDTICPGSVVPFIDNSDNNPNSWSWTFNGGSPSSSTAQHPTILFNTPGVYQVGLNAGNAAGSNTSTQTITVLGTESSKKYLLYETFENSLVDWTIDNPDGSTTWQAIVVAGTQYGNYAAYMNNYVYNNVGQKDAIISKTINTSEEDNLLLELDYAYRRYDPSLKDKLRIYISTNNGASFPHLVFTGDETGGGNFATASDSELSFLPVGEDDWCFGSDFGGSCISVDLSEYAGFPNLKIKIESETGYGNNMFIDNIRLSSSCDAQQESAPIAAIGNNNASGCAPMTVQYQDASIGNVSSWNWTFPGGSPSTSTLPNPVVSYNSPGTYNATLVVSNSAGSSTTTKQNLISVGQGPTTIFTYVLSGNQAVFTNLSSNAQSFTWDFGDGTGSVAASPIHQFSGPGTYTVRLVATNACGSTTYTETIIVLGVPTADFSSDQTTGCAPLNVQFTDQSTGQINTWQWTFEGGNPSSSTLQNPQVSWATPGTYNVELRVINAAGESVLIEEDYIIILDTPTAAFDYNVVPDTRAVSFTSTSTNATSYSWDFGDGSSSEEANPTHTYSVDGDYVITLTATNTCGESEVSHTVNISTAPTVNFNADNTSICAGESIQFNSGGSTNVSSYAWTFEGGNPTTSNQANPTVTYSSPGSYTVTLTVSNSAGEITLTKEDFIQVGALPFALFEAQQLDNQTIIQFTNTSTNATSYQWTFGDGATSTMAAPNHDFGVEGTYNVTLIASNECGLATYSQEVTVVLDPSAGFTSDVTAGCAPLDVQFTNQASDNVTAYSWSFGDGGSSTLPNPTHTFLEPGSYGVTLTVSNAAGSETTSIDDYIQVNGEPGASFTALVTPGDRTVAFTNTSENATSYLWSFGDGTVNNAFSPSYTFAEEGTYTVSLTAYNECGESTFTQDIVIVLSPSGDFMASSTIGCSPMQVFFTPFAHNDANVYEWSFEGGTPATSSDPFPEITYSTPGTYTVSLRITNPAGESFVEKTDYIEVNATPVASFEFEVQSGTRTVQFSNTSTYSNAVYWDFGDGTTSSEENPSHTYLSDGEYSVTLIIGNACGSSAIVETIVVASPPIAGFGEDDNVGCPTHTVQFTDQSTVNTEEVYWIFEGGTPETSTDRNPVVTYSEAGRFDVTLIASNSGGSDTLHLEEHIEVGILPNPSFSYIVEGNEVIFYNTSQDANTYRWDFGDGNTSIWINPTHVYDEPGTYLVTLTGISECGETSTMQYITIGNGGDQAPVPDFDADVTEGCGPISIQFTDLSLNNPSSWFWEFEGGYPETSNSQNPSVFYDEPGVYSVTLTVTNGAGSETYIQEGFISVQTAPISNFSAQPEGNLVNFTNESLHGTSYFWDFGDGNTSNEQSPQHIYQQGGDYTVSLVVSNSCGSDTIMQELSISNPPAPDFSADSNSGCAPFSVTFTDQSGGNPTSWFWTFEGGYPETSNSPNPMVFFDEPGVYTVSLQVTNASGQNTSIRESFITVYANPVASFTSGANGSAFSFTNTSQYGNAYFWSFGDGNTSEEESPMHQYQFNGDYTVQLIVQNDCGRDTVNQIVQVQEEAPSVFFSVANSTGCSPLVVQFENQSSSNVDVYEWHFPGGTPEFSSEEHPVVTYDEPGSFDVILRAGNVAGTSTMTRSDLIVVRETPISSFNYQITENSIELNNLSQFASGYEWKIDGIMVSEDESITLSRPSQTESLAVELIAKNLCGRDTTLMEIRLEEEFPLAAFSSNTVSGCGPLDVQFMDLTIGNPSSWFWEFEGGEPATSTDQNPLVSYTEAGLFNVRLTVGNTFGSHQIELTNYVNMQTEPVGAFEAILENLTIQLNSQSLGGSLSHSWNFGDGTTSTEENPSHTYSENGLYEVRLIVENQCGVDTIAESYNIVITDTYTPEKIELLQVYPNPNDGGFNLKMEGEGSDKVDIVIFNAVGQLFYQTNIDFRSGKLNHYFDFNHWARGIYMLQINVEGQQVYRRVIIE